MTASPHSNDVGLDNNDVLGHLLTLGGVVLVLVGCDLRIDLFTRRDFNRNLACSLAKKKKKSDKKKGQNTFFFTN